MDFTRRLFAALTTLLSLGSVRALCPFKAYLPGCYSMANHQRGLKQLLCRRKDIISLTIGC